ncbi:hypothetical protein ACWGDX_00225 [Streptomyces sp. NPDC055025]
MSGTTNAVSSWGRSLFERQQDPVRWAGTVLDAAAASLGRTPEIEAALALAGDESRWAGGRGVFDLIRKRSLDAERPLTVQEELLFRLAELVGKLAHNSAGPYPHFDHHVGRQVGPITYRLAHEVQDPALTHRLAAALGSWPNDGS